jgi:uncharacterized protein (DUF302 family)
MKTMQINVDRIAVTSAKPFGEVVKTLEASVGHPDMQAFGKDIAAAQSDAELEGIVHRATGDSGLMVFMCLDPGEVIRKEQGGRGSESLRFLIGNPLIMRQMAKHVPDAASYAPVTILVDERPDGVHLSYDRMVSFLSPYGNPEALKVARDLDLKVEALLTKAAG